jgi:hypothetical protein
MARLDESEKERKKVEGMGGHASAFVCRDDCAALQPCDGVSVASGVRAIIPAARALLVVAAPQK